MSGRHSLQKSDGYQFGFPEKSGSACAMLQMDQFQVEATDPAKPDNKLNI
jgi:hypothetical protein